MRWSTVVAPLVGAWIEIFISFCSSEVTKSLPLWERGLKYYNMKNGFWKFGRSPCGSVD